MNFEIYSLSHKSAFMWWTCSHYQLMDRGYKCDPLYAGVGLVTGPRV